MKILPRAVVGWRVMATVKDAEGLPKLRPISRTFHVRQAADDFVELSRATHPDAYVQAVNKIDKLPSAEIPQ